MQKETLSVFFFFDAVASLQPCHVLHVFFKPSFCVVSGVEVKLGMSGWFVERGLVVLKGRPVKGLANLLVYGSTLLFQGQR